MFKWSNNQVKLNRAMAEVEPEATEEQIKAEYIRIGGKLNMSDEIKQEVVTEEIPAVVEEVVEKAEVEVPKEDSSDSVVSSEAVSEEVSENPEAGSNVE